MNNNDKFWLDRDVQSLLETLSMTGFEARDSGNGKTLAVTVEFDPIQTQHLITERQEYLTASRGEEPAAEDVVEQIVSEIGTALDAEFNTIGHSTIPNGQYRRPNDHQWKKIEDVEIYDAYSDILFDLTGEHVDYIEQPPTVPGLREPFLEAVAESTDHELPPPGAVNEILSTHLEQLRELNESRGGVRKLKAELEREGVDPRTATRVANNMDEFLINDAEIKERFEDDRNETKN